MSNSKHHEFCPSSLDRLANCPGSYIKSKPYQDIEDAENEDAIQGNKLHAVMAGKLCKLTNDEEIAIEKAKEIESKLLEQKLATGAKLIAVLTEHETQVLDNAGNVLTEGTLDKIYIFDDGTAIIIDWKFGRIKVYATRNMQMASYSTGVIQKYKLEKVEAYIAQPFINWIDNCTYYDSSDVIEEIIKTAKKGNIFATGEWCTYCPALKNNNCPLNQISTIQTDLNITTCDNQTLVNTYETSKRLEKFIAEIKKELKSRIETQTNVCGYRIKERNSKRIISDVNGFIDLLGKEYGISTDELLPLIDLPITKVEELFISKKNAEGFTKKDAKELFKRFSIDYIEVKTAQEIVNDGY